MGKCPPECRKGAMGKGVEKRQAEETVDLILKFGGYGFNKSHSTRYAIVAFQTAYMKTYHPVEYMAALLTYEMGSTDKVVEATVASEAIEVRRESCFRAQEPHAIGARGTQGDEDNVRLAGRSHRNRVCDDENQEKYRNNPAEHAVKFTAEVEEARGRVARGHTGPPDIDYHGGEDYTLPCAFYESSGWVSSCCCALRLASCSPASPENGTVIRS